MKNRDKSILSIALLLLAGPLGLMAGSGGANQTGMERFGKKTILDLTLATARSLDARSAGVAFVGRTGRPLADLPEGIRFTHVGIALYEANWDPETGEIFYTYSVYNLYESKESGGPSYLARDFLFDQAAGVAEPYLGVVIPTLEVQKRIAAVLQSERASLLHQPNYNLIANPADGRFDNCVTWTLKVLFAGIYQKESSDQVLPLIAEYFEPTPVRLSMWQRMGTGFSDRVSLRDQPSRIPVTATLCSIEAFLKKFNLLEDSYRVFPDGSEKPY
jgi:hypothetical protein